MKCRKTLRSVVFLLFLTFLGTLVFLQPGYAQFHTTFEPIGGASPAVGCKNGCVPKQEASPQPKPVSPQQGGHATQVVTKVTQTDSVPSQTGVVQRTVAMSKDGKPIFAATAKTAPEYNRPYKSLPGSGDVQTSIKRGDKNSEDNVKITLFDVAAGDQRHLKGTKPESLEGDVKYGSDPHYDPEKKITILTAEYYSNPKEGIGPWAENYLEGYEKSKSVNQLTEQIQSMQEKSEIYGLIVAMEQKGEQKIAGAVLWYTDPKQYKVAEYVEEEGKGWFKSKANTTLEKFLTDLEVKTDDKIIGLVRAGKLSGTSTDMFDTYLVGKVEVTIKDLAYDLDPFINLGNKFSIPNIEALVRNSIAKSLSVSADPFAQGIDRLQQLVDKPATIPIQITLTEEGSDKILARFNRNLSGTYDFKPGLATKLEDLSGFKEALIVAKFGTIEPPESGHSLARLNTSSDRAPERLGTVSINEFQKFLERINSRDSKAE